MERHPARRQDRQAGRRVQEPAQRLRGVEDLLQVVDDQQELPVGEVAGQRVQEVFGRILPHADGARDRRRHDGRVRDRAEVDQEHTIVKPVELVGGEPECQAGLARAAGAREGEQPGSGEELAELGELALPSHERAALRREVRPKPAERPQRREIGRQPADRQVVEVLGMLNVLQPVPPQIPQGHALREVMLHQAPSGDGHQHLAAVARRRDAGGPVDVDPHVVVTAMPALARVQAHPYAEREAQWPGRGGQLTLGGHGSSQGSRRGGEDREEGVSLRADLGSAAARDRPTEDLGLPVLGAAIRFEAERLEESCGPLDIGEQERDGPGWKLAHGACIVVPAGSRSAPVLGGRRPGSARPRGVRPSAAVQPTAVPAASPCRRRSRGQPAGSRWARPPPGSLPIWVSSSAWG